MFSSAVRSVNPSNRQHSGDSLEAECLHFIYELGDIVAVMHALYSQVQKFKI